MRVEYKAKHSAVFQSVTTQRTAGTPTAYTVDGDGSVAGSPDRDHASWQDTRVAVSMKLAFLR